ncbi:tRNA-specific adenosine deaminase [Desulfosarcina widdelii]|uniref:tRNA-specific adenosine deaminase n=1 Tax=Desulfosarcina widdelii TaxID=947919 RepID=A0A5K7Z9V3_9BACT|nr:nucleoside deaminase [Desulfosarcina widdelii]BBO76471.1 tRNA-specific adenosine deaminase [Desulfosarcina widdelii]
MTRQPPSDTDTRMMTRALALARQALSNGEFPVGCVIAVGDTVVAEGHRLGTSTGQGNEIDHAEINAIRQLNRCHPDLDRSTLALYSTMEPCLMCFSAILLSGIDRIVYAYEDVMGGGTGCDRSGLAPLYRDARLTITAGVLREQSLALFRLFFADSGNPYWADSLLCRYTLDQLPG